MSSTVVDCSIDLQNKQSKGGAPLWEELWTGANAVRVSGSKSFPRLAQPPSPASEMIQRSRESGTIAYQGRLAVGADVSLVPPDGSITTEKLAHDAVTTPKIADEAV